MINDINMNKINPYNASESKISNANPELAKEDNRQEEVAVTNHLNKLLKLFNDPVDLSQEDNVVSAIKQQILNNQYKIDFNTLSEKIIRSGALAPIGE
ncbi:MAG: hypothetical protein ACYCQI_02875 [Gammaproteobacteria bacterium]